MIKTAASGVVILCFVHRGLFYGIGCDDELGTQMALSAVKEIGVDNLIELFDYFGDRLRIVGLPEHITDDEVKWYSYNLHWEDLVNEQ